MIFQRGLRKFTKRVKNKEIVIRETDKSGKLFDSSFEAYVQIEDVHTNKDKETTWSKVVESKKLIQGAFKSPEQNIQYRGSFWEERHGEGMGS